MEPTTSVLRLLPLGCFFLAASCNDLARSRKLNEALIDTFLGYWADQSGWTQTIVFTAVHARMFYN
jgi:hypothetical protein